MEPKSYCWEFQHIDEYGDIHENLYEDNLDGIRTPENMEPMEGAAHVELWLVYFQEDLTRVYFKPNPDSSNQLIELNDYFEFPANSDEWKFAPKKFQREYFEFMASLFPLNHFREYQLTTSTDDIPQHVYAGMIVNECFDNHPELSRLFDKVFPEGVYEKRRYAGLLGVELEKAYAAHEDNRIGIGDVFAWDYEIIPGILMEFYYKYYRLIPVRLCYEFAFEYIRELWDENETSERNKDNV